MKCPICKEEIKYIWSKHKCYSKKFEWNLNKKGQVQFYAFMLGFVVILMALALAPVVMQVSNDAQNTTTEDRVGMDCSNESISDFQRIGCYALDLSPFYFIGSLIMIGGVIFTIKIIFQ